MTRLAATFLLAGAAAWAQAEFEAASVKASKPTADEGPRTLTAGPASLTIRQQSLRAIIEWAYQLRDHDALSGPAWMDDAEFDIVARTTAPVPVDQIRAMLRALLHDRFGLEVHREQRNHSVFALTVAKSGLKLQPSTGDPDGRLNIYIAPGMMAFRHTPMTAPRIAEELHRRGAVDRPVVDRTGLTGVFDLDLHFACTILAQPGEIFHGCTGEIETAEPAIFKALEEQLGLHLEPDKLPIETVVIDWLDRTPKGN
jgi:uncharacterized protein (TIGR03435 family)